MSAGAAEQKRVFLHVGSPKTGTTFLQQVLWRQRQLAADQGVLLPLNRFFDHYLASLDVRGIADRAEHPGRAVGSWDRLVTESMRWPGTVLVSHELFAAATVDQAARAVAAFGSDAEVHVVITARDLVRQIPAEWQEHLKHRSATTFPDFVEGLRKDRAGKQWFWRVQDFAGVAERWGQGLPATRVHVVTVPPVGAPSIALWTRFASLLGLDPQSFNTEMSRSNTSLGAEQAALLRRVNAQLGHRLPLPGPYPRVVKNVLAHRVLARQPGTPLTLRPDDREFAVRRSGQIAERLAALGVDVVGSLDELVPAADVDSDGSWKASYEEPAPDVLLDESVAAITGLLQALNDRNAQRRYEELTRQLRAAPLRFALIRASERRPWLGRLRRVYQRRTVVTERLRRAPHD